MQKPFAIIFLIIYFLRNSEDNYERHQFPDPDVFSHPSQRFRLSLNPDPDRFTPVAEELAEPIPRDKIRLGELFSNLQGDVHCVLTPGGCKVYWLRGVVNCTGSGMLLSVLLFL